MEYEILGISEGSSIEEAKKALNKIRLENHPDKVPEYERKRANIILKLAESAYKRVRDKNRINHVFTNLFNSKMRDHMNDSSLIKAVPHINSFGKNGFHNNIYDGIEGVKSSSYSYQNNNGNITESGTINGKPMSEDELNKHRLLSSIKTFRYIP
tara:strand:+ start:6147 stop:6611 length:465 start_codon:yes stop_codon:yes gene_type:complete